MSINDLLNVMPPHVGAGVSVDWHTLERAWGTGFPADYKAFIEHYGPGAIENFLAVFVPTLDEVGRPAGEMAEESWVARDEWESEGLAGVDADPDQLLAWATDGTADLLCWLRTDGSPDDWPVLVYERGRDTWQLYHCGMVEFLIRIFRAELPRHPLSGTPLWAVERPRFLTGPEQRRIRATGQDPWE
ncbi:SMI1/KNR4 family protein [Streptomyces sp. NPDC101132]|uniref:SMI1/KNR4 family protein n=1 Tax=Streptomyces sp. NPDC101132 TaxID=3366110 RepID=UPI0037F7B1E5